MKKKLIKISALLMAFVIAGAPVAALADSSYTYNYDYWEEYQESPDIYTPVSVLTSTEIGLGVDAKNPSMSNPEGLYVNGDELFVCDTGNNRILQYKRTSKENLELVRIIDRIEGAVPKIYVEGTETGSSETTEDGENADGESAENVDGTTVEGTTEGETQLTETAPAEEEVEEEPVAEEPAVTADGEYNSLIQSEDWKNRNEHYFYKPTDFAVSADGNYFIADSGNARILKVDKNLNYICQFLKPQDESLDKKLIFKPTKIAIDTAERVYCIASGINKGLVKFEPDATFSGFIGATPVTYDFWDWLYKKFASAEKLALLPDFTPTEYSNVYMDHEGFVYTTASSISEEDLKSAASDPVRRLNLMGGDILIRNGNQPIYGDIYFGTGGGYTGPSRFADITVFENDVYAAVDRNRGRIFIYDDQGNLICAFGGGGNRDGYFGCAISIEHMGYDLIVLDQNNCNVTIFSLTEYGKQIFDAIDYFDHGDYDNSGMCWQNVKDMNGNCDLAYIGIGRSLLRQKRYKESMDYFEVKYDADNYSKAFKQYRKEWVEENIATIVIVLVIVFAVPLLIGKLRSIKHEIDVADIFNS